MLGCLDYSRAEDVLEKIVFVHLIEVHTSGVGQGQQGGLLASWQDVADVREPRVCWADMRPRGWLERGTSVPIGW